jgi:hypothetical protein
MNLPRHAGQDDAMSVKSSRSRRTKIVVGVAVLAILGAITVLHVTGVIHGH